MGTRGAWAAIAALAVLAGCGEGAPPAAAPTPSANAKPAGTAAPTVAPTTAAPTATPTAAPTAAAPATAAPTATPAAPRVTMTTHRRTGRSGSHRWTATYPTLHGLPAGAGRKANAALTAAVSAATEAPEHDDSPTTTEVTPELWAVDDVYVSVRLYAYLYADGAAHGITPVESYVFDRRTGDRLTLPDFLKPGTRDAALRAMSAYTRRRLPEVIEVAFEEGMDPTLDNYATVAPLPEGLQVTFAEYQVAPYAQGTPTMVLPWRVLQPYLAVPLPSGDRDPAYRDGNRADTAVLDAAAADPRVGRVTLSRAQVDQYERANAIATRPDGSRVALRATNGTWRVVDVGPSAGCTAFAERIRRSLALRCS